jgi:hypothetical protein
MRPLFSRPCAATLVSVLLCVGRARAQATLVPLTPDRWTATDSLRFETHLGRPSLYIDRGVALVRGAAVRDGTIEYDMAIGERGNFFGAAFHAAALDNSEVIIFRVGNSGTPEAVQYAPALNGVAAAWQVYHGEGSNAAAVLARDEWLHVRLVLAGDVARVYLRGDSLPTLTVPRLAGVDGAQFGVWGSAFGRGAWFANVRYTPAAAPVATTPAPPPPRGTIAEWELSEAIDASVLSPDTLPTEVQLRTQLKWDRVRVEPQGWVLVNRYRRQPNAALPVDPETRQPLVDSIVGGRVAGTKVVFARTTIDAPSKAVRRLSIAYSDGAVVYLNGQPLFAGMNPGGLNDPLAHMPLAGQSVYLPLKKGKNDLVLAVTEYTGGWAFAARLEP